MKAAVYDFLRTSTPPQLRGWLKSKRWFNPLLRHTVGFDAYSHSYFAQLERHEASSMEAIADWLYAYLQPAHVLDVGCGPGHLMEALARRGAAVHGVDVAPAAEAAVVRKGFPFSRVDLTAPGALPGGSWDLVVCCEVAEHLEERHAATLVRKLTCTDGVIFMTAAEPSRGGLRPGLYHYNEQPHAYWIDLMHQADWKLDRQATEAARADLARRAVVSYLQRPMLFRPA